MMYISKIIGGIIMRIVWKDSSAPSYKPLKYRGYVITGSEKGWSSGYPGDDNLYKGLDDAKAALNKYTGLAAKNKSLQHHPIRIVGKKSETA
jgi:hypothetical protein